MRDRTAACPWGVETVAPPRLLLRVIRYITRKHKTKKGQKASTMGTNSWQPARPTFSVPHYGLTTGCMSRIPSVVIPKNIDCFAPEMLVLVCTQYGTAVQLEQCRKQANNSSQC